MDKLLTLTPLITFLLTLGLLTRVVRLVVVDTITAPARTWLFTKAYDTKLYDSETQKWGGGNAGRLARFLHKVVTCPWCFAVYAAPAALASAVWWSDKAAWQFVALAATLSLLAAAAVAWFDGDDDA
jgi:hypothetical protein